MFGGLIADRRDKVAAVDVVCAGISKLTWSLLLTGSGFIILAVDWKGEEDVGLLDWDLTFQYKDRILEMRWRSCGRWMREV